MPHSKAETITNKSTPEDHAHLLACMEVLKEIVDSARGRTMAPEIRLAILKAAKLLAS